MGEAVEDLPGWAKGLLGCCDRWGGVFAVSLSLRFVALLCSKLMMIGLIQYAGGHDDERGILHVCPRWHAARQSGFWALCIVFSPLSQAVVFMFENATFVYSAEHTAREGISLIQMKYRVSTGTSIPVQAPLLSTFRLRNGLLDAYRTDVLESLCLLLTLRC